MTKILIAADLPVYNLGIKTLVFKKIKAVTIIESTFENTQLSSFREVLSQLDLAILSVESHDDRIFDAIRVFREPDVKVPVLVISSSMNIMFVRMLFESGAGGYVLRNSENADIVEAIGRLFAGALFVDSGLLHALIHNRDHDPFVSLTRDEMAVAIRLMNGEKLDIVAQDLGITAGTLSKKRGKIYRKLDVTNMISMMNLAAKYHFPQNIFPKL